MIVHATMARRWLDPLLSLVYPDACQLCATGRAGPDDGYVCTACRAGLRFVGDPLCQRCGLPFAGEFSGPFTCGNCAGVRLHFEDARAAVRAEGVALEVIHRYKYQQALWFEPLLGRLLVESAGPTLVDERWDAVIPVPLHPVREREREFNQADRLGRILADAIGIPLQPRWLRRSRATDTQTRLTREKRHENVRNAFEMDRPRDLSGGRFVVVDDVLTTGATTSAVAAVLRRAGAERVVVRTVARGV